MHISGERQIPAARARVWRSLADAALLPESLTGIQIDRHGAKPGGLILTGTGTRPIPAHPSGREPFATLSWTIDPAGPESQSALVRLAEDGAFTRLSYEILLADPDGGASAEAREADLQGRIETALERFANQIAGPAERATGGLADAMRATRQISPPAGGDFGGAPAEGETAVSRILDPSVIGGALFLGVLMLVLGLI